MIKTLVSLVLIAGACGGLLVATHMLTDQQINLNREAQARVLMGEMLQDELPNSIDVNLAYVGNCGEWLFLTSTSKGYAGPIVGLSLWRFTVLGPELTLRVLRHQETPGIGDFIDHQRDPWMYQLDRRPRSDYAQLDNVTGATITSEAIRSLAASSYADMSQHCEWEL